MRYNTDYAPVLIPVSG